MPATANSAIPHLWKHVQALGYQRSHRSIINMKNSMPQELLGHGVLSSRTIRDRFDPDMPSLADQNTSQRVVDLLNFHLNQKGMDLLNAANEVVLFRFCVSTPPHLSNPKLSEHGSDLDQIAISAGLTSEIVEAAFSGRLLPKLTCEKIAHAAGLNPADSIVLGKRRQAPVKDARLISAVLEAY